MDNMFSMLLSANHITSWFNFSLSLQTIGSTLQALQVAHESQSRDVAKMVGSQKFKEEVLIEGTKLTAIDIIAMTFILKHHPQTHSIR